MIACYCDKISVSELSNYDTFEELLEKTMVSQKCESCREFIEEYYKYSYGTF